MNLLLHTEPLNFIKMPESLSNDSALYKIPNRYCDWYNIKMFGLTTSQSIASVLLLVFIVMYFAATNGLKQNAFIYLFGITAIVLIVGTPSCKLRLLVHEWSSFRLLTSIWELAEKATSLMSIFLISDICFHFYIFQYKLIYRINLILLLDLLLILHHLYYKYWHMGSSCLQMADQQCLVRTFMALCSWWILISWLFYHIQYKLCHFEHSGRFYVLSWTIVASETKNIHYLKSYSCRVRQWCNWKKNWPL